jgi:hypothetical protein
MVITMLLVLTQPESIRLLGCCNTPGIAYGCAVQESIVFVADAAGRKVMTGWAETDGTPDVSRLPAGVYYVTDTRPVRFVKVR